MRDFDINKITGLAMLALEEGEMSSLKADMEEIVSFAERISEAGAHVQEWDQQNVQLREDRAGRSLTAEDALAAAPEIRDGFFFVPQVVE